MKRKPKDRHLDVPAEANRDKHINFVALERGEMDPADERGPDNLTDDKDKDERSKSRNRSDKRKSNK